MNDLNNTANNTTTNTAHNAATDQDKPQRDEKGRFSKGNRGGPGNPFARQTAKLRQAALDAVSEDDIRDIFSAMKEKAKAGDVAASKLLLSYSVGKPTATADPDTLDQHELKTIVNDHVRTAESIVHVIQGMPIEALLIAFRAALPELLTSKMQTIAQVLTSPPAEEDDDDDLIFEDDAQDAASETENVAAAQACVGNDNIPAWMYEMANANRAVAQTAVADQPQRRQESPGQQQKTVEEAQKELVDLLKELKAHHCGGDEQVTSSGQPMDGELLRSLLGRMKGNVAPVDDEVSPLAKRSNGAVEQHPS